MKLEHITNVPHAVKNVETLYHAIFTRYCLPEEMNWEGEYFECLCRVHFGNVDMQYFLNDMPEAELNAHVSAFNYAMIDHSELCMFDAQELALEKLTGLLNRLRSC